MLLVHLFEGAAGLSDVNHWPDVVAGFHFCSVDEVIGKALALEGAEVLAALLAVTCLFFGCFLC